MSETFVGIIKGIEYRLGIPTMTYEYEIVACFFDKETLTPNELATLSSCSSSTFFNILKRLEARRVVRCTINPTDRRSRVYSLSDNTTGQLSRERMSFGSTTFEEWRRTNGNMYLLKAYSSNIRKTIGIRHLTCEYQILLNLYYRSGITNMEFTDIVDASLTKFNQSLRTLSEKGLIYFEKDPSDKRIKRYFISDKAKDAIEEAYRRLYRWGQEKALLAAPLTPDRKRIP